MQVQPELQPRALEQLPCPVCASEGVQDIFAIPQVPILANVLCDTREAALAAPRGDLQLAFCPTCGHVFNRAFDPARMDYNAPYENSLHFSPRFQSYAAWLARHLVSEYDLHGKAIIEIGSGKGDFLRMLCEIGGNVGTGFDPSYEPQPGETPSFMSFIKDVYSERYADHQADLILFRHVLEHIYHPADLIASLRRTIGSRKRTVVFCEVPNFSYILRDTAIWDLIYEHYSYFSPQSLTAIFSRAGFNILNLGQAFNGQFLYIEAIPREMTSPAPNTVFDQPVSALAGQVSRFATAAAEKLDRFRAVVSEMTAGGKRAVLWGAGSKGISFLNMLNIQDEIRCIVDINPRKRGKFVTGSGQQIVPPEFLKEYKPDAILIMNPIYQDEIRGAVKEMGLRAEYHTAL